MRPPRLLEWPRSASAGRILTAGLVIVCLVGLGIEAAPESRESNSLAPSEFRTAFALPVPDGAKVVMRSIEPKRWRSLLVLDLDPKDPPEWTDTVLLARLRPIPGVLLGQAMVPCDLPEGGAGAAAWWSFANRLGVRTSSHPSVVDAVKTASPNNRSENPFESSGAAVATPTSGLAPRLDSPISTPVRASEDR
ncbi:MAG: hypothetical protein VX672_09420 [Planctomycetota bacterium]|nr:hypothetical protein [Planctomycetota bacterium]